MGAGSRFKTRCLSTHRAPHEHVHVAIALMYAGSAFRGLQLQTHGPTHHTIEGVVIQALRDIGAIEAVVAGRPQGPHHHLARSCRTDRGVHAIRNVVSIFVPRRRFQAVGSESGMCEKMNAVLPAAVRVARVMRIASQFVPRNCCNRRVYRYLLPAYALLGSCDSWQAFTDCYSDAATMIEFVLQGARANRTSVHSASWRDGETMNRRDTNERNTDCDTMSAMESRHATAAASLPAMVTMDLVDGKEGWCGRDGMRSANLACLDGADAVVAGTTTPSAPSSWLSDLGERVAFCNTLLREHVVGSHRFHNFSVDAETDCGSRVSEGKLIHPDSDEAARMIYRAEIAPRVFLLPRHAHGPSWAEYVANLHLCLAAPKASTEWSASATQNTGSTSSGSDGSMASVADKASTPLHYLPFVIFQIEGGSFLFNMIRKIVGSLLALCRGARTGLLTTALSPEYRVRTPLAPGSYLMLAMSFYEGYDRTLTHAAPKKSSSSSNKETVVSGTAATLPTFREAWSGNVCTAFETYAQSAIYADVVDVDCHVLPPLEDMLAARDAARKAQLRQRKQSFVLTRGTAERTDVEQAAPSSSLASTHTHPCDTGVVERVKSATVTTSADHRQTTADAESGRDVEMEQEEDGHLQGMAAYRPVRAGSVAKPACSAMTMFLRLLRVHNWSIQHRPLPSNSKAMLQEQNRLRRATGTPSDHTNSAAAGAAGAECEKASHAQDDGGCEGMHNSTAAHPDSGGDDREAGEDGDADSDGWIYVAPTHEMQVAARKAHHRTCRKRSRDWVHVSTTNSKDASH